MVPQGQTAVSVSPPPQHPYPLFNFSPFYYTLEIWADFANNVSLTVRC